MAASASEKYVQLKQAGFVTKPMTRNKAGSIGWVLTNGSEFYFCRANVGLVRNNEDLKRGNPRPEQVGTCLKNKAVSRK
jgi:hypothetical protein